jgi:hypothetical protein
MDHRESFAAWRRAVTGWRVTAIRIALSQAAGSLFLLPA